MKIGVPKEIKDHEYRVGLVPSSVRELVSRGHQVLVQAGAGQGVGIADTVYQQAGAEMLNSAKEIFQNADMIVKVKEPQPVECKMLKADQVLFTYLHLAPNPALTRMLQESGVVAIAYETVTNPLGQLPLLMPMSEIAGRMAIQVGAFCLEKVQGGRGILLGGVPGVAPAKVVILGGGSAGSNALRMAVGLGAQVTVIDRDLNCLRRLSQEFGASIQTLCSSQEAIEHAVISADLVIGAVLVPGDQAPKLVTRALLRKMQPGSALVDISIDQGGCFETSRPTTFSHPIFIEEGIVHYCVTNLPGGAPRTSAFALNNATLPYVLQLADKGYRQALKADPYFAPGLNVHKGHITHELVAKAVGAEHVAVSKVL
jgi:alanine dehydrogenase